MSQIRFARFHLLLGVSLVPMLRSPTAPYLVTGALKEAASRPVEDKVHCTALHCIVPRAWRRTATQVPACLKALSRIVRAVMGVMIHQKYASC